MWNLSKRRWNGPGLSWPWSMELRAVGEPMCRTDGLDRSGTEIRTAARLLLFDESGRVLLFRHNDGQGREFWATPGGGLEAGETAEQAGRREATEELGAAEVDLVLLWTGHSEFAFANRRVSQTEIFFLVRRHSEILGPEVRKLHEGEGITEIRWWSLGEIESAQEPIFPSDLATRVRQHTFGER